VLVLAKLQDEAFLHAGGLAKLIQWKWPDVDGEDKFTVMFGGVHIEMTMWKNYGNYLDGSGWTNALVQAGIASQALLTSF